MEIQCTAVDDAKRMLDLEADLDRLTEEKLKLEKQAIELKDMKVCVREMQSELKRKYIKLKEELKSAHSRLKEEENNKFTEKYWESELEKRKLHIEGLEEKVSESSIKMDCVVNRVRETENRRLEELGVTGSNVEMDCVVNNSEICKLKSSLEMEGLASETENRRLEELGVTGSNIEMDCVVNSSEICNLKSSLEMEGLARDARNQEGERSLLMRDFQVLEKDEWDIDAEICDLKSIMKYLEMDSQAWEAEKQRVEERVLVFIPKINVLEQEKEDRNAHISNLRSILEMYCEAKRAKEANYHRVEKEKILELVKRIQDLEKEKVESRTLEADNNAKISELEKRIVVLERDRKELEVKLHKENIDKSGEYDIVEVKALDAQKERAEEAKKQVSDYLKTIQSRSVKREKEALESKILEAEKQKKAIECRLNEDNSELAARIWYLERDRKAREATLETDKNEKISKLEKRIVVLERDKIELEAELHKEKIDKSGEYDRVVEVKGLEVQKEPAEEAKKQVLDYLKTIRTIPVKRENEALESKILEVEKQRRALECRLNEENSELAARIWYLERDIKAMEAEISKKEMERKCVTLRMQQVKKTLEDEKIRLEEKVSELKKRSVVLEGEKAEMEAQIEKEKCNNMDSFFEVMKALEAQKLRAEDAEKQVLGLSKMTKNLKSEVMRVVREKKKRIKMILNEKKYLSKVKDVKISDLKRRTWVLEKQKAEMGTKLLKATRKNSFVISRIVELEKALDAQIKRAGQLSESLNLMGVLKRENEALEAEIFNIDMEKSKEVERILFEKMDLVAEKRRLEEENKISYYVNSIEALERVKAELEVELCKEKKDKNNESYKIVELKKALEAQKRRSEEAIALKANREKRKEIESILNGKKMTEDEGTRKIEVAERKKKEMETKFCQVTKEKSEEILRIKNEKMDLEAKNLELADRIGNLETEKRGLEVEIMEKDRVINALAMKSRYPFYMEKELDMEITGPASNLEEDVGTLSAPWQNEGQNFAVAHSSEHTRSTDHNVTPCKRRRPISNFDKLGNKYPKPACEPASTYLRSPSSVVDEKPVLVPFEMYKQMFSTRSAEGNNGGEVQISCEWKLDQDLLDAFDVNPELCLKAVCALYRQYMRLADSTNCVLSPGSGVFRPEYSLRAITLGEYLTTEEPEGRRMHKLVRKLNKLDPLAIGVCRGIAKQHYKQVFQIYKTKEDPFFMP